VKVVGNGSLGFCLQLTRGRGIFGLIRGDLVLTSALRSLIALIASFPSLRTSLISLWLSWVVVEMMFESEEAGTPWVVSASAAGEM